MMTAHAGPPFIRTSGEYWASLRRLEWVQHPEYGSLIARIRRFRRIMEMWYLPDA